LDALEPRTLLLLGALAVGVAFGVISRYSSFCFRSAVLELLARRVGFQVLAWGAAIAIAVTLTQSLVYSGYFDLTESVYLGSNLMWLPIIVGGALFGIGMILARGCGARHMVLLAGGNLRSAVVLSVLGITAYMTLRGILAIPRTTLEELGSLNIVSLGVAGQSLPDLFGWAEAGLLISGLLIVATGGIFYVRGVHKERLPSLLTGAAIGVLITGGWYVTGVLGFDDFDPVRTESLTFTAPVGNAIQYLMTYTGATADFGIVAVAGVIIGAFLVALLRGQMNLEAFETPLQLLRYVFGGGLMGFGGVLALGCTVGAGLSGLSTLSLGSIIATFAIFGGALIGDILVRRDLTPRQAEVLPAE